MTGVGANGAEIPGRAVNGSEIHRQGVNGSAVGAYIPITDLRQWNLGNSGADDGTEPAGPVAEDETEAPDSAAGYVIHLPVTVSDLTAATHLAVTLGRSLRWLPYFDTGETTVTEEGDQRVHHRVFCDRRLDAGRRCPLRDGHPGPCVPPTGTTASA